MKSLLLLLPFLYMVYYVFLKGRKRQTRLAVYNQTKETWLARNAIGAYTFARRVTGLLNHSSLPEEAALVISPAGIIHMKGMSFPIDLVFIDRKGTVTRMYENITPDAKSTYKGGRRAHTAIELNAGACQRTKTALGDNIEIKPT